MNRLGEILAKQGRKKNWLKDNTGFSYTTIKTLMKQDYDPPLGKARKVAKLLGVTLEEIWPCQDD